MSAQHYFKVPFALSGDKAAVPDAAVVGGDVSYTQGYGPDYSLDPATDPDAKRIEREKYNQLLYDITTNLQQYQLMGFPEWITAAQNGGVPVSYARNAHVTFSNEIYRSTVNGNVTSPPDPSWALVGSVAAATTTAQGVVELATNAEAIAGVDTTRAVVPSALAATIASVLGNSPYLGGTPTTNTPTKNSNNNGIATTAFAQAVGLKYSGVTVQTGSGAFSASQVGLFVYCDGPGATQTLPSSGTCLPGAGFTFINASSGVVTIAAQGGDQIYPFGTPLLLTPGDCITVAATPYGYWMSTAVIRGPATNAEVLAAINVVRPVTPASLASFPKSIAPGNNGQSYFQLPGGMILQALFVGGVAGSQFCTFPITFPHYALAAVVTNRGDAENGFLALEDPAANGVGLNVLGTPPGSVYIIAIGW